MACFFSGFEFVRNFLTPRTFDEKQESRTTTKTRALHFSILAMLLTGLCTSLEARAGEYENRALIHVNYVASGDDAQADIIAFIAQMPPGTWVFATCGIDPLNGVNFCWGQPQNFLLADWPLIAKAYYGDQVGPILKGQKGSGCSGSGTVGNPCSAGSGNKYQLETDFSGGEAVPAFSRAFNSSWILAGSMGSSWTANPFRRLDFFGVATEVRRADGRGVPFTKDASGSWQGDPDSHLGLIEDANGYTLTQRDGAIEHYDPTGKLLSEVSRNGRTSSYGYDASGRLLTVTGPFGHVLTFSYDTFGHVSTVTDPNGGVITYTYDAKYNLERVNYPDLTAKRYFYEDPKNTHALTGIAFVSSAGVETRFSTYGYYFNTANSADPNNGKATLTQHADIGNGGPQEKFSLAYDSATQTTVTNAVGTNEVMTFATNLGVKNLVSNVNQADGKALYQTFDANNNLTCKQDEEGRVTTYTYNASNQKTSQTEGQGGNCTTPTPTTASRTTSYQYLSPDLDLPTLIETPSVYTGSKKRVSIHYDANRNPDSITQSGYTPAGASVARTVTMGYNAYGQVTSIDGARTDVTDVTTLSYYDCTSGGGCGQLKKVTNALGHITTYDSYDASGRLLQMSDANGVKTVYTYDARGRVLSLTQSGSGSANRVTTYGYDAAGNVISTTLPTGLSITYSYDTANYLRRVTDSLGNRIDYGYDLKGNRTQTYTYDASGTLVRSVDLAFDVRNHVNQINAGGSITQQVADALGNLTKVTDPNTVAASGSAATNNNYDALNRLYQTIDRLSGSTIYGYDANDRLKTVQAQNGARTKYLYDDLGNLLQETSPDRGTVLYSYDTAGNLLSITDDRPVTATYSYDALNRLTGVSYSDSAGVSVTYSYDSGASCTAGIGRLCQVADESGTTQYAYDGFGNVVNQIRVELGTTYATSYSYDASNRVIAMTGPDGRPVSYNRDAKGQITDITATVNHTPQTIVSGRGFRPDGLLSSQSFGNGLAEVRAYDVQGRLREQYLSSADTRLYAYDANGNLTGKQSLPEVGAYQYDALDRLTDELAGTDHNAFSYDGNGNRLTDLTNAGKTRAYVYAAATNRLQQMGAQTLTLDAAGYTLADRSGARSFAYDHAGLLAQVTMNGVVAGQYSYNALGQRTHKLRTTATGTVQFVYHYDLGGRLIAETRPNGTLVRSYLWADDEPVAQIQNKPALAAEELVYLHTDALGTPRLATDATQTVVWRFESQAFGTGKPETDPDGNGVGTQVRLRFAGQYYDAESGLHYNWNRYYDPRTGRYVTSDPIGLEGGLNTYAYVLNNPAKYYDFSGLYPDCIRKFIGSKTNQHDDTYVTTIWYQNVPLPENPRLEVGPGAPREPPIKPSIVADWWMWQIALKNTKTYHVWEGTDFFKVTCVDVKECKKTEFSYIDSVPRPPIRQVTSDQNAWTRERLYFIGTYSF